MLYTLPTLRSKVEIAVDRIQYWCPPEGYHLAFSGGKDSCVIEWLAWMAGVHYTCHYAYTTVDPPEVMRFIRRYYPEAVWHRPKLSMWKLIEKKWVPPTRKRRYCCEHLKEYLGAGEFVLTGIRRAESSGRSNREMVHTCMKNKTKKYLHPIIDWSTEMDMKFSFYSAMPKGAMSIRIRRGKRGESDALVWETIFRSQGDDTPKSEEGIISWIDKAHELTDDWFFKLIAGDLLKEFE